MGERIVGTNHHQFYNDHGGIKCLGILGNSLGVQCGGGPDHPIHSLPEGWRSWTDGPNKPESAFDSQVGGSHYKKLAIQPLEFIVKNELDFLQGNVVKYVVRYKVKNGLEDLKKARHYLDLMIELKEKEQNEPKEVSDLP